MICLVTDRRRLSSGSDACERLVDFVTAAAGAGVDLIQIRERDLDARRLTDLVRQCVAATEGTGARVVVNDRADIARAAGAAGVHLRSDSIPAGAIRAILPAGACIGRSVHSPQEAGACSREGALDYLVFGTLFETPSKARDHRLATLEELTLACRAAAVAGTNQRLPVLGIGGMTLERAAMVARAGAAGIAAIGLFIPPAGEEPTVYLHTIVQQLRRTFDTCQALT